MKNIDINIDELLINYINGVFNNRLPQSCEIQDIADYICSGNLVVRYGLIPRELNYESELKYNEDNFNWNFSYREIPGAFQLYVQGLSHVWYLLLTYEKTKELKYINLADKLIFSWINYDCNIDKLHEFTWYDHSVSDRSLVLVYFDIITNKDNIRGLKCNTKLIEKTLINHGEFLNLDSNYTTQNHGTMMDRSLYILGKYINKSKYRNWSIKAILRIKESLERDFSREMVNLENSPEYHIFNLQMYMGIQKDLLNKFGDSITNDFENLVEKAIDFLVYMCKPNYKLPMFGDGGESDIRSLKKSIYYNDFLNNDRFKYILTDGKDGLKPTEGMKVYKDEGYIFFRNNWDFISKNSTYLSFKAGYKLKNHKHGDDLSITMFSNGQEVFVDSGTYTYEPGDYRRHFISALAHNTVVVNNKTYPFIASNSYDTYILDTSEEENYYYAIAVNNMYTNIKIVRTTIFIKSGDIIIFDKIISNKTNKYTQIFNLHPDLEYKQQGSGVVIELQNNKKIYLKQLKETNTVIKKGDKSIADKGLYSTVSGKVQTIDVLEYSSIGNNKEFITTILNNDKAQVSYDSIKNKIEYTYMSLKQSIDLNDLDKKIKDLMRKENDLIVEKIDDNFYKLTIDSSNTDNEYAWYVENESNKDVIWYNSNKTLMYLFEQPGVYNITYFVLSNGSKKMYTYPENIFITSDMINKSCDLNRISEYIEEFIREEVTTNDEREYYIKLNSKLKDAKYAWYVLDENNEKIDVKWYQEKDELVYKFNKRGKYKIQYFIMDNKGSKKMFYFKYEFMISNEYLYN